MQVQTLIEAGWLIPIVPKGVVYDNYSVAIDDGRIVAVLPTHEARESIAAKEVIQLPGQVVLPGLVNLHSHAAMNLVRGLGADLPLMDWLTTKIWPAEGKLMSPEFVRDGSYLAGCEMISSGVTCTSDHYFFPDAAAQGLRDAGMRCAVSAFVIGFPSAWAANDDEYLTRAESLIETYQNDPFVHTTVAPHAPYTVSDATLHRCALLSEKWNLPIHMHVNETAFEVTESLKTHGKRPIERLHNLGLLNERLIAVHSVHASDADIEAMAKARASACHCPCSNLKLGSGFSPIAKFLKAGVNLGIGTDGAASNDKLDMLGETRLAAMLAKAVANDTTIATVADMLEAATLGGAKALKWDHEIGSLEVGKAADMIAIDLTHVETLPIQDAAAQLLYSAGREQVSHVWVAGELLATKQQTVTYLQHPTQNSLSELAKKWQNRL